MKSDSGAANHISDVMQKTPVGELVSIYFLGQANPILVKFVFIGGWVVEQKLIPGMPLEFTRGENGYLENMTITVLPYEGLK